jgi:hypothetical protein
MKIRVYLFLFGTLSMCTLSCSEEIVPSPYSYTKVFTGENSKTWKIKFLEITLNGKIINRFSVSCTTDDRYVFYSSIEHKFVVMSGINKCNGVSEPNTISDTWTFTNSSATLTMILLLPGFPFDSSLPFIVRDADSDEMELEIFVNDDNSESYRIHFEVVDEN